MGVPSKLSGPRMTRQQRSWAIRLTKAHLLLCGVATEIENEGITGNLIDVVSNAHCAAAEAVDTLKSVIEDV